MKLTKGYCKEAGRVAWALNIVSGIAMGAYLLMSAALIVFLALGESGFTSFVAVMASPLALFFEMAVFLLVLYHIFNGIRILLVDCRLWVEDQKDMFYVAIVAVVAVFAFHCIPLLERFLR